MEDGAYRTHQRLECFVKRHLGQEICDALRISEKCIVVGESYDHAFKFVTLTEDTLYILANPPQIENDIELTIELQNISDIKHVHDIPDFLSGELQKNAQHVSIRYSQPILISKSLGSQASLSSRASSKSELKTSGTRSPNLRGNFSGNNGSRSKRPKSPDKLATSSSNFQDSANGRSSTIRFKIDDLTAETRERSHSDPLRMDSFPSEAKTALAVPLKHSTSQNMLKEKKKGSAQVEGKSSSGKSRPLPPPAPGTEMTNALMIKTSPNLRMSGRHKRNNDRKAEDSSLNNLRKGISKQTYSEPYMRDNKRPQSPSSRHRSYPLDTYSQNEMLESMSSSTHSLKSESSANKQSLNQSFTARIGSFFGKSDDKSIARDSTGSFNVVVTLNDASNEEDVFQSESKEKTIDIYLLKGDSQFITLLRSTRINSIMSLTLRMARAKERKTSMDSSKMLEEFSHLKEEILKCTEIEKAFILTKELLSGARKRPLIKKLFWKSPELITWYNTTLDAYLINHNKIIFRGDEADELDYMLIIADLVICMIFNTEILPSRNKILFGHRGSLVCKMMKTSLMKPDLLKKKESMPLSNAAALLLAGVEHQQRQSEKEIELTNLLGEWTDACSSVVYELLNATEQCTWTYREGRGISLHTLISSMEKHPHIETFLSDLIGRMLDRLLKDSFSIKYSDVVLLYKQFTVLHFIFDNSPTLSKFLSDNYYEEFRYYIGSPQYLTRIPECPISSMLHSLILDVTSLAVGK